MPICNVNLLHEATIDEGIVIPWNVEIKFVRVYHGHLFFFTWTVLLPFKIGSWHLCQSAMLICFNRTTEEMADTSVNIESLRVLSRSLQVFILTVFFFFLFQIYFILTVFNAIQNSNWFSENGQFTKTPVPEVIKLFFVLSSAEHEKFSANKSENANNCYMFSYIYQERICNCKSSKIN